MGGLVSSCTSFCASFIFAGGFRRRRMASTIAASVVVALISSLMPLPFALVSINHSVPKQVDLWSTLGVLGVMSSIVGSIATMFTVLPIDTLVTSACSLEGCDQSTTALAAYLSCYDFGSTVGGLITVPCLASLGLDGKHWQALPVWIIITACAKLIILTLLPLLPPCTLQDRAENTGSLQVI